MALHFFKRSDEQRPWLSSQQQYYSTRADGVLQHLDGEATGEAKPGGEAFIGRGSTSGCTTRGASSSAIGLPGVSTSNAAGT